MLRTSLTLAALLALTAPVAAQDAQSYVERLISQTLSSNERLIEITGLDIGFAGDVEVERIQLQDSEGAWLTIEGLELDWSPLSLLRDQIEIDLLAAETVTIARTPFATPSAEEAGDPTELIAARVDALRVGRLNLGEALVGQDVALTLEGAADLLRDPATIQATLNARRVDEIAASLTADVTFAQATGTIDLDLALNEAPGGLVSALLPLQGTPSVDLDLQAQGTLADLAATLALQLDGAAVVSGQANVASTGEARRITADLDADLASLTPDAFDPLVAGTSALDIDVTLEDGLARIETARITSAVADATASGVLDLSGEATEARLNLRLGPQDGTALTLEDTGAGPLVLDDVTLDATIAGRLGDPEWNVIARGQRLEVSGLDLARFDLTLDGSGAAPSPANPLEVALTARGQLEAAERLGIPGALQGAIDLQTRVALTSFDDIALNALTLSTDEVSLEASGSVSPQTLGFDLTFDLAATSPETGIAIADALLAGNVAASGRALRDPETDALLFDGVALNSDVLAVTIDGQGNAQNLDVTADVRLSDLSALSPQAEGAVELNARVTGPAAAPRLDLTGSGDEIVLAGQAFTRPRLDVDAVLDAEAPSGTLAFTGELGGETVDVSAQVQTDAEGVRRLTDLDARVASARLAGALALPREGAPTGTLNLDAPDLADIAPLVLTELAGALRADIVLEADETARATISGADIAVAGAEIESLSGDVTVETYLSQPTPQGRIGAEGVAVGGLAVPTLDLTARQTDADAFAAEVAASVEGLGPDAVDIAAEAEVRFAAGEEDATRVALGALSLTGNGLDATLAAPATLVLGADATRIEPAELRLGGGAITVEGLVSPRFELALAIEDVSLALAEGFAPDLDLAGRIDGTATLTGASDDPEAVFDLAVTDVSAAPLAEFGAPPLDIVAEGSYANGIVEAALDLTGPNGRPIAIESDLLDLSGLTARAELSGALEDATWSVTLDAAALEAAGVRASEIDLALNGEGVTISQETPIRLDLEGSADLAGEALPPELTGVIALDASASIADLESIQVQRARVVTGSTRIDVSGELDALGPAFELDLSGDGVSPDIGIEPLNDLLEGNIDLDGRVAGDISANTYTVSNLRFTAPALNVTLDGRVEPETVDLALTGTLADLGSLSPQVTGRIGFDAMLTGARAAPDFTVTAEGARVVLAGTPLDAPRLEASGTLDPDDLAATAALTGRLGGAEIDVSADLAREADGTLALSGLDARIGAASLTGDLALPPGGAPTGAVRLDVPNLATVAPLFLTQASAARGSVTADLALSEAGGEAVADVTAEGSGIVFNDIRAASLDADLTVADYLGTPRPEGRASVRGLSAAGLDFASLDLDAAQSGPNRYAVTLDADGTQVSLDAAADLTLSEGETRIDLARASGRAYGVPIALAGPATVTVGETVRLAGVSLDLGGGRLDVSGTVSPELDLDVAARAIPLGLADIVAPDLALAGALSGTARVTGTPSDPQAVFDLAGQGLTAAPLQSLGLTPLSAQASGRFVDRRLTVSASASGPFDVAADGSVDLAGPTPILDVTVSGTASTAPLADRLARAGVRADADLAFDVRVTGPATDPTITGSLTADGATVGDAQGQYVLRDVSANVRLDGDRVVVERVSGALGPGSLTVTGTIGLDGALPADLAITIDEGRVAQGSFAVVTLDANLDLFGPLLAGPTLSGNVDLVRTLITLNDLPVGGIDPIEVRHVNAPEAVLAQARRLGIEAGEGEAAGGTGSGAALFLDVAINTRQPISVTGRGLDVALEGNLRLVGPIGDPRAVGAFTLVRGRLLLLDRRLTFDRARLDFTGSLTPRIDFAAVTQADGFAITLRLFGRVDAPEIAITSVPDLPQDEALARLLFGRALSDLSPLQLAKLAQGISRLTGGTGPLDGALAALGLSGLEIDVDDDGNATFGLGRQLNDRTYVNVEQSSAGSSRVVIDLEITDEVKARGRFSSDGASGLGVFFEREY